jgi:hypothetical protein
MSGPVTPPLEVTEVDGSPDGRPITKIVVSNGDLTVSGRTATIDTTGAGVSFPLEGSDGSGAAPTYSFSSDTNTGMYRVAADTIGFSTGGTSRFTLTTLAVTSNTQIDANEVTIGNGVDGNEITTNTAEDLVLNSNTGTNSGSITIQEGVNNHIQIVPNGTGDVELGNFNFDVDQTVGVGQDNYVLTYDNTGGKISLEAAGGGGVSFPLEADAGSEAAPSYTFTGDTDTGMFQSAADKIGFTAGGTERLVVGYPLEVNAVLRLSTSFASGLTGPALSTSNHSGTGISFSVASDSNTVSIVNAQSESFRFGAAGELGIGGATYGTSGQLLTSGGTSAAPTWADAALSTTAHATPPVNASDTGTAGQLAYDADYFYVCIATDTWKRTALSTW